MCAMYSSATIPPRSWWTGQLMAKVPTAGTFTSEARQAISCAAARTESGGALSTTIKGRQWDSPPDVRAGCASTSSDFTSASQRKGVQLKRIVCSLLVATLPFGSVLAAAPKEKNAKVTLVFQPELPNVPGK